MSYYHQKLLIPVINHLSGCTEKIDEKARNIILQLLCAVFPVYFILCYSGVLSFWTSSFRHIVGYVVLLLIVLISIKGEVTEVKWRDYIYYPFVLLGLGLIITGLIHPIGGDYFFSGVAFVFIFPALYLVWDNRRDYDVLIDALAKSIVIVGVLYAILCVCLAFTGAFHGINHRWSGTMVNVNLLSMTGINLFTAAVYMVLKEIQQSKRVFYTSAAACGVGFAFLGASRISICLIIIDILVLIVYLLLQKKRADKGLNKPKTKEIIVLVAVFFAVFFFVSIGIPSIQTSIGQAAAQQTESVTDDKADSENNAASNDNGPSTVYDRFLATDKDGVDSYSSGRTIIWKRFAEDLNLIGHDITQVNWPMLTGGSGYAHNTFLEFSYRSGIPVGILFLALELAVGIVVIRIFFTGKGMNECFVMILLVTIAFLFESTLDIGSLPFIRFTPLLYYIGIATIISADHPKQGSMINIEK